MATRPAERLRSADCRPSGGKKGGWNGRLTPVPCEKKKKRGDLRRETTAKVVPEAAHPAVEIRAPGVFGCLAGR